MDSLTQIALGAAVGEAVLGKKIGNKAALWGAVGGVIPDLDVAYVYFMEPVSRLIYHRGFTHSILFAILMAPVFAFVLSRIHKNLSVSRREWGWLGFLSVFTHPVLDCFTTYGTQIFYPFSDYGVAFNTIFIVDPLYTLPLLLGVIATMIFRRRFSSRFNQIGLTLSALYLALTVVNKLHVTDVVERSLEIAGISHDRFMSLPTPANNILWRVVATDDSSIWQSDYSLFDESEVIQFTRVSRGTALLNPIAQTWEVQNLRRFSKEFFLVRPADSVVEYIDLRFGDLYKNDEGEPLFIFRFHLHPDEDDDGHIRVERLPPEFAEADEVFPILWNRIKGN